MASHYNIPDVEAANGRRSVTNWENRIRAKARIKDPSSNADEATLNSNLIGSYDNFITLDEVPEVPVVPPITPPTVSLTYEAGVYETGVYE